MPRPKKAIAISEHRLEELITEDNIKNAIKNSGNYFTSEDKDVELFSSGCQILDCILGGGFPVGRMVNIVGSKAVGKSLLAIEACANFIKKYPDADIYYHEAEAAFDRGYAEALGMPVQNIVFVENRNTVEDLFKQLNSIIEVKRKEKRKNNTLYIIDSLDALTDEAEKEREFDASSFGAAKAKKMSELFRRLVADLQECNITFIVISQVRDNLGASFGDKTSRSGGRALDFYASQILWLQELGKEERTIKGVKRVIGINARANCKKNKIGLAYRKCDYRVLLGYGIDDIISNLDWLDEVKRLDELGIESKDIKKLAEEIRESGDKEYQKKIADCVKRVWMEIENDFMPKAKKY